MVVSTATQVFLCMGLLAGVAGDASNSCASKGADSGACSASLLQVQDAMSKAVLTANTDNGPIRRLASLLADDDGEWSEEERLVGRRAGTGWDIFDTKGAKFNDVSQGALGTCYFLAVLVSIAKQHPKVIEDMFVERNLWEGAHPVYVTQWMIDGKPTKVAVNDMIPADKRTSRPFFVKPSNGADLWPLILEKTWAKMFGTFKQTEGGLMAEAFKAITQAPVSITEHDDVDTEEKKTILWNNLVKATAKKYPMGGGTRQNNIGIPSGHAFAILGALSLQTADGKTYPQVLHIYNPWGRDQYAGVIPNVDKDDGMFHITFDEFLEAYDDTTIAEVEDGAVISERVVEKGNLETTKAFEFEMTKNDPFAVQLEWPSKRFLEGCDTAEPLFTMTVAKDGEPKGAVLATKASASMTNARASMKGGKGKYIIFLTAEFPTGPWLKEFIVNVYGTEKVTIKDATSVGDPVNYFLTTQGLAKSIEFKGMTFDINTNVRVNGMPCFVNAKANTQPGLMYWSPKRQENYGDGRFVTRGDDSWYFEDHVEDAKEGSYFPSLNWKQAKPKGGASLLDDAPEHKDGLLQKAVHAVHRGTHKFTSISSGAKPACGDSVSRLASLDNSAEISKTGKDADFPETELSIAPVGVNCGDSAADIVEPCSKFNNWESFATLMQKEEEQAKAEKKNRENVQKCITSIPNDGRCGLENKCADEVKLHCLVVDNDGNKVNWNLSLEAKFKGTADIEFCSCTPPSLLEFPDKIIDKKAK